MTAVGRVLEINRYPVKSMAGERCAVLRLGWQGFEGDRQYGFVKRDDRTRFPWLTGRDLSDMVRWRALYERPDDVRTSPVRVQAPDGGDWAVRDAGLRDALEEQAGTGLWPMQLGIGAYDTMPVSVVTTGSLARLDALHGRALDRRRFRANLVVECEADERAWAGARIGLGDEAAIAPALAAPRCAMVTICPDTGARDPGVLRTVAGRLGGVFTMYAGVARPGVVRVGDVVRVG